MRSQFICPPRNGPGQAGTPFAVSPVVPAQLGDWRATTEKPAILVAFERPDLGSGTEAFFLPSWIHLL